MGVGFGHWDCGKVNLSYVSRVLFASVGMVTFALDVNTVIKIKFLTASVTVASACPVRICPACLSGQ